MVAMPLTTSTMPMRGWHLVYFFIYYFFHLLLFSSSHPPFQPTCTYFHANAWLALLFVFFFTFTFLNTNYCLKIVTN